MTLYSLSTQTAGLADGTALTATNAPPVTIITKSATPTISPSVLATYPVLGRQAFVQGGAANSTSYARVPILNAPKPFSTRFALQLPTVGSSAADLFFIRGTNSNNGVIGFGINGSNQLQVKDGVGVTPTNGTWTTAVTTSNVYLVYLEGLVGTTTSNGTISCRIYNADKSSLLWSFSSSAINMGTFGLNQVWLPGKQTGSPNLIVAFNHWLLDDSKSTGAADISRSITVSAGSSQTVKPWKPFGLVATGSADLGISSETWTQTSGPTTALSSTASRTPTGTTPADVVTKALVYRRSLTDYAQPSAQTATSETTVTVPAATWSIYEGSTRKVARTKGL